MTWLNSGRSELVSNCLEGSKRELTFWVILCARNCTKSLHIISFYVNDSCIQSNLDFIFILFCFVLCQLLGNLVSDFVDTFRPTARINSICGRIIIQNILNSTWSLVIWLLNKVDGWYLIHVLVTCYFSITLGA